MNILFGNEKGGCGKSTLAVQQAAMRAGQGRDVLLVDTDKESGSAHQWAAIRAKERVSPAITCVTLYGETLAEQIRALSKKYDDIVIDAGGKDSVEMRAAMIVCDAIITPCAPSQFDAFVLAKMNKLVGDARAFNEGLQAGLIVNRAPTNTKAEIEDMLSFFSELNHYDTMTTVIADRKVYRSVARDGMAATEYHKPDERALVEMNNLYREIWA